MENILQQISLMESLDAKTSENAVIQLKNWMSEGDAIPQLVEYYARNQSIRALELLCLVQEPHDKILLDEILEHMNKNRHGTLVLIGRIVQKAPGWLAKIPRHNLFRNIVGAIQLDEDGEYISAAILFVTSIIPYATTVNESIIENLIQVFVQACRILKHEKTNESATDHLNKRFVQILQVRSVKFAAVKLFHALYALYPHHLLHSLRNLNTNPNDVLHRIIEDFFLTVRLHPALIFECKEGELSRDRWMAKEPHDFFALSQRLSAADTVDYDSDNVNEHIAIEDEAYHNLNVLKNIPRISRTEDFDSSPFLGGDLMTPPLINGSREDINEPAVQEAESTSNVDSERLNGNTLIQKIGAIFKTKNASSVCRTMNLSKTEENIVEYTGNYVDYNATSQSTPADKYRNAEWAVECVESMEYDCLDKSAEQLANINISADRPSTSGLQTTSDKRTTSESHANNTINATQQFISCQNLGRASSLTNLYDVKNVKSKILKSQNIANANFCSNCQLRKESNLERFENARQAYISASLEHHLKMKSLNLLSRTPGRMYDDMHHIIKELPMHQQCEVLSARLRLVNQHLLFERYCRIMHENRNRRLFGKLKQYRTEAAERRTLMELEHNISAEMEHQQELYSQLNQKYLLTKEQCSRNEDIIAKELENCEKKRSALAVQLETLQLEYVAVKIERDTERKRINQVLLQKENLMADKKLMEIKLKEVNSMKSEFLRLQQDKLFLEMQLRKKTEKTGISRNRAEDMIAPLYEAQLKNVRLQLRKMKMALSRMTEKTGLLESRWKEELDRRFDLQSTLNHASLIHSKNLESATHKFNALLAICNKQEAHIFNLHRALEQNEAQNFDEKKSYFTASGSSTLRANSHAIAKSQNTFDCDSSYIFSDAENRAKIAGLFSTFGDILETKQSGDIKAVHKPEPGESNSQKADKMNDQTRREAKSGEPIISAGGSISSLPDDPDVHD